jgi:glycosyltransferase involved in cell wall biosynthesis
MWCNSANKFFDALASGTPVAINYSGWQEEILKEHGAGIVLDPQDTRIAAGQLLEVLQDQDELVNLAKAAGRLAEDQFDREKLVIKLERVLEEAASSE